MALDSKNILGCPYCGYRVGPSETSCPRCGNGFTGLTKFECPFCGDMVTAGTKECPSCHIDFAEFVANSATIVSDEGIDSILLEIINMESSQVKQEERKFSCPKCSWMLDGSEETCPKCGEDLSKDAGLQCPICGAFVKAASSRCPECGTSFGPEAAAKVEMEERHEKVTSALTDLLESLRETEPAPEPEPVQPEPPPPAPPEPIREPEPMKEPEPPPAPSMEAAEAASEAAPKKARTRKLKAKPGANKPS